MLILPSWGGMLNGLFTLRGAWDKVREDPILKFFVVALTCYGMATFEGPLLSLKNVNAYSHYSDWTVAHVHVGALGWNGFLTFGMLYWLIPRLYNTKLHSIKLSFNSLLDWYFRYYIICCSNVLVWFQTKFNVERFHTRRSITYQFMESVQTVMYLSMY
jgi:cytochrome c oxidase cbb3-type subunit I/II